MAARKSAPVAETPPEEVVSAPEPTPEPEPEPVVEIPTVEEIEAEMDDPDAWGEPEDAPPPPPEPIRTYEIPRPEPTRAGGYVLTQSGWVLDTTDQEG